MNSKLRIIPMGGCGEIGKNMTVIEYGNDILVVDAGIMFPENDMLGVDSIIPDYQYLVDNKERIRAVLITHGHEDHVGALPHLMKVIDAPIYATAITMGLIEVKLKRAGLANKVELKVIKAGSTLSIGSFIVEPFHVTHSIPDCLGYGITSPAGLIVHTGDYKFDHTPEDGWPPDFAKLADFSSRGVLCLLADSTNATTPGWTRSEAAVVEGFDKAFREAKGRIIVASFASLISRIKRVATLAEKYGRHLALAGRSMRDNAKMAQRLGYLKFPDGLLVNLDQTRGMPAHKVVIMATGSQGEPTSVLGRLARGRNSQVKMRKGDTIVISAHTIPGNEEMTGRIINMLMRKGANVLYEDNADVHVSGHGSQEEMKLMINLVRPKYFIPVHGEYRHLQHHSQIAMDMGIPAENIAVIENGTIVEMSEDELTIVKRLPGSYVFVQGRGVGDVGFRMVRDRERLAKSGFLAASIRLNHNAQIVGDPQVSTEGFIDLKDNPELVEGLLETMSIVANTSGINSRNLNQQIEGALRNFLFKETGLRPRVYVMIHK